MQLDAHAEQQLLQETKGATILIVDDEEFIRDLCARALSGYRTLQAENGREALQLLARNRVDLVLADVMMPVMNGLDLLQRIKQDDPEQAVVVMTGFADKDVVLRALKESADDLLQKPISLLQMRTTVARTLEKKALRRELLQLRQLDRLKADFLGLVSHKLRTPATAISLFIQNLADGTFDTSDPQFIAALAAVKGEADYLAYLIQDLLYYSDIILQDRAGQAAPADLKELALAAAAEARQLAGPKRITLECALGDGWPQVSIDRRRITFALKSLLDNAVKFTPAGGTITLTGEAGATELRLTVTDNGPGIPQAEIAKVFEKFYQVDPHQSGQVRGFGLGLFYARQFVRDHGGTLELASHPGLGCAATIRLPRAPLATDV